MLGRAPVGYVHDRLKRLPGDAAAALERRTAMAWGGPHRKGGVRPLRTAGALASAARTLRRQKSLAANSHPRARDVTSGIVTLAVQVESSPV